MAGERGPATPAPETRHELHSTPPGRSLEHDLDRLLEDYTERLRRGEHPSVEEYAARRPDLAEDIRLLFPAMDVIEDFVSPSLEESTVPERIGDFRIVREAGRGGMGVVYEAVQESLGRRVALKVLPRDLVGDAKGLERFRREARAAARLHHTNIVPVFGVGEEAGVHYFAMQFIEGQSLGAIIDEARHARGGGARLIPGLTGSSKAIPAAGRDGSGSSAITHSPERRHQRAVAGVGLQVAEALAYAHTQGILHRDIKPSNLLLDAGGTVWITDFGLAKADEADPLAQGGSLTQAGDIVGTIAYLAPERLEGKSDARSDVYALGLTIYELLTLVPAFQDENRKRLLKRIAEDSPLPPRQLDPSIPRDLETIVLTAIAREPDRRYSSAARLADDLRGFLAGRPIAARRASSIERLGRWCRRQPALAALCALVIVLLVAIAALSSFGYLRLRELLGTATVNLERARSAEGQARAELRRSYLAQAHSSRVGAQPGRRLDCLDAVRRAVELGPLEEEIRVLRDEAIASLALVDLRVTSRWHKEPRLAFGFAPDLKSFAVADPDGKGIVLHRVADGAETALLPVQGAMYGSLHFSSDGRFLAARLEGGPDRIAVVDLASREWIFSSPEMTFGTGVDFHPPTTLLAFAATNGSVHLIDLAGRREITTYDVHLRPEAIAFHPSGERIAFASPRDGRIQIVDARSGREIASVNDATGHPCVSWSGDGSLLAAGSVDGSVGIWEFAGSALRRRWAVQQLKDRVVNVFFNHGGSLLATYSWSEMLRLWDASNGDVLLAADWVPQAFSPDDRRLALVLGNYEAGLAEVAESPVCCVIDSPAAQEGHVTRHHVSPDGRLLACTRKDPMNGIELYDLTTRRYLSPVPVLDAKSALFSADGRWLFTGGRVGLQRWPIEHEGADPGAGGGVQFGFPETLEAVHGGGPHWISQSADGKTLAMIGARERSEIIVVELDGETRRRSILGPHVNVDRISLRPDGKRLASSTWLGVDVKVWNTRTGELELTIPLNDNAHVEFSPDGRWLAVMAPGACFLHDAVTFERTRRIEKPARGGFPGVAAFRADGKVLAISSGRKSIRLIDPATGADLATLEAPAVLGGGITFHPDGSRLYAAAEAGHIHDWDIALLRGELSELGLDWAEPAR